MALVPLPELHTEAAFESGHPRFGRSRRELRASPRKVTSGNESMPSRGGSVVIRAFRILIEGVRGRRRHGSAVDGDSNTFV